MIIGCLTQWTRIVDLKVSDRVTKSNTLKKRLFGKFVNVRGQKTFMQTTRVTLDLTVTGHLETCIHIPFQRRIVSESFDI